MDYYSFINEIKYHYDKGLPFVVFRGPEQQFLKAWLQESKALITSEDLMEEAFVFAPYKETDAAVIFPKMSSKVIESKVEESSFKASNSISKEIDSNVQKSYQLLIEEAVLEISKSNLKKVVLSRSIDVEVPSVNPIELFQRLEASYKNAFVYCWYHPKVGLWLGATPERLLNMQRQQLKTVALAGTLPLDLKGDWTEKERQEQQLVTDYIVEQLSSISEDVRTETPKTVHAGSLKHLKTAINAKIDTVNVPLKALIEKLHPTPAVCGYPKSLAQEFILKHETYNREFYTGYLGEINVYKSTSRTATKRNTENKVFKSVVKTSELFVNLRCLQLKDTKAIIYVGGGIVEASVPEREWQETLDKSLTMMRIL